MARFARVVAPGFPHHITQRGNRRQQVFFCEEDYRLYLSLMSEWCSKCKVAIWAYCLMPNHVHLITVPTDISGLGRAIGEAHRRYSLKINTREGWTGHLWQDRFASFPMDERYLLGAARYIEMNPVRARLTSEPGGYRWSSAKAHLEGKNDQIADVRPLLDLVPDWGEFLNQPEDRATADFSKYSSTGRPLGDEAFCLKIASVSGIPAQRLLRGKPGPKKKPVIESPGEDISDSGEVLL